MTNPNNINNTDNNDTTFIPTYVYPRLSPTYVDAMFQSMKDNDGYIHQNYDDNIPRVINYDDLRYDSVTNDVATIMKLGFNKKIIDITRYMLYSLLPGTWIFSVMFVEYGSKLGLL